MTCLKSSTQWVIMAASTTILTTLGSISTATAANPPHLHCDIDPFKSPPVSVPWLSFKVNNILNLDIEQTFFDAIVPINVSAANVSSPPQTPPCLYEISDVTSVLVKFILEPENTSVAFDGSGFNGFKEPSVTFNNTQDFAYSLIPHAQTGTGLQFKIEFDAVDGLQDTFLFALTKYVGGLELFNFPIQTVEFNISGNHYYQTVPEPSMILGLSIVTGFAAFGKKATSKQ